MFPCQATTYLASILGGNSEQRPDGHIARPSIPQIAYLDYLCVGEDGEVTLLAGRGNDMTPSAVDRIPVVVGVISTVQMAAINAQTIFSSWALMEHKKGEWVLARMDQPRHAASHPLLAAISKLSMRAVSRRGRYYGSDPRPALIRSTDLNVLPEYFYVRLGNWRKWPTLISGHLISLVDHLLRPAEIGVSAGLFYLNMEVG